MVPKDGKGHDADVHGPHVGVALRSRGTVDFDGASIIGTACMHAMTRTPDGQSEDPSSRKGLKPAHWILESELRLASRIRRENC